MYSIIYPLFIKTLNIILSCIHLDSFHQFLYDFRRYLVSYTLKRADPLTNKLKSIRKIPQKEVSLYTIFYYDTVFTSRSTVCGNPFKIDSRVENQSCSI